jgi:ABC-type transport system substrate-binding protein
MRSILAACSLALVGCSRDLPAPIPHGGSPEPRRGGILELATFADVRAIDPANVSDGLAPQILETLFAGLIDYDAKGEIVPDLAERWSIEDEGKTFRFVLREGARFHDGSEVTAEDVKRSVERALHPTAPNPYSSYFTNLVGYADLAAKKADTLPGVVVEGRHVVAFHLREPDATFLPLLAMPMLRPVCESGGTRYSDRWHPCGAGPFELPRGGWQRGHSLTVRRHEGHWRGGRTWLDGVRWTFHVNQSSQTFKFLRGDLDVAREFASPDLLRLQADPRWTPFGEYELDKQVIGEAMNVEMPPFDNVEIRRAVASALDRDAIRKIRAGSLRPASQLVPPGVFGFDESLEGQRFDLGAALEHMRRAGYPFDPVTKTGGWPSAVPYVVYKASVQEFIGQVVQQQLARIGIRIELEVVNYPTFIALRGRRHATAFGSGFWTQDFPDALSFLEPLFHSKSIAQEDSNNWSFYSNARFDELVDRAHRELDGTRRKQLYSQAQAILVDDAPWAFDQSFRFYTQRQPYVRGYRTHAMWSNDLTDTWIDRVRPSIALFTRPRAAFALLGEGK